MSYPFAYPSSPSYGFPVTSPAHNPREKYLAALAGAKAAEAEYLAAEKLQQEENALRSRLEQIQQMKYHPAANTYAPVAQYHQAAPQYHRAAPQYHQPASQYGQLAPTTPLDLGALRRQIAAEERARIICEQGQALELEARELQQARELETRRLHEARKAHHAREKERGRALAAQRSELSALTHQALSPAVRFIVAGEPNPHKHHCRPHHAALQEPRNTPGARREVQEDAVDVQDLLGHLFGGNTRRVLEAQAPAHAPAPSQAITLQELIKHALGDVATSLQVKPQAGTRATPQTAPVTVEQIRGHFLGAAGIANPQPPTFGNLSAPATTSKSTPPPDSVKPTDPVASPSTLTAPPTMKPDVPAHTPAAPAGMDHILEHFFGGAAAQPSASNQVHVQRLMNMFPGASVQAPNAPNASCSNSQRGPCASSRSEDMAAREERELAEAIRLSLAESHAAPASPNESTKSKGKAPAPMPVLDVASSAAEVHAIDAAFSALAGGFAFPAQLDFSTSRAASPARSGTTTPGSASDESAVAKLSYSALNQPVRVYHQALSGLLGRLDAVDSLGDEGLRTARKEVVGQVESALDEVERVIEARWRKFVGREERKELQAETQPAASVGDASAPGAVPAPSPSLSPSPSPAVTSESSLPIDAPAAPVETFPAPVDASLLLNADGAKRKSDAESDWSELDAYTAPAMT